MKLTRELVRQIEDHLAESRESLIRASLTVGPNSQGYAIYRDTPIRAHCSTNPNAGWAKCVSGLNRQPAERVRRAIAFFAEHGVAARARIVPDGFTPEQADVLAELGLRQIGFHTILYAPLATPSAAAPPPDDSAIDIRMATTREQVDAHIDIQLRAFNVPPQGIEPLRPLRRAWWMLPDRRFYLAYVDGTPAAQAMLFCRDGIAYLESAGTLPEYRSRGLQTALIRRRIADAIAHGCTLVYGGADFEGSSRTNQIACGLQIAYTAALWSQAFAKK
ncbi:hypothetical protein BH10PLA1_BH10PLA1_13030 [soil metagenome]